jgi:hypothetical protein
MSDSPRKRFLELPEVYRIPAKPVTGLHSQMPDRSRHQGNYYQIDKNEYPSRHRQKRNT